jgi:microcompartment protein CcmL/EutN
MKQALGMIETKGLVALFEATDAMLKSANVTFAGWQSVGSGLVTAFVEGDVAAVKAANRRGRGSGIADRRGGQRSGDLPPPRRTAVLCKQNKKAAPKKPQAARSRQRRPDE